MFLPYRKQAERTAVVAFASLCRVPLDDAQRALRIVRSKAKNWQIDPNRIGILLERLVTFFYYRASIDFIFDDGVFQKAELGGYGVK